MPSPSVKHAGGEESPPRIPFFAEIDKEQVKAVMAAASRIKIVADQLVYQEGDTANRLFLLDVGTVKLFKISKKGDEVLLALLSPGDVLGLAALLQPLTPYQATASAVQDCELFSWQRPSLLDLVRDCPQVLKNSMLIVFRYLCIHAEQVVSILTDTAEKRLARTLLHLGDEKGRFRPDGVEVEVSNEHLSALAHVSPFTASRLLNKWKRSGRVEKTRGKVVIHSPELLVCDK